MRKFVVLAVATVAALLSGCGGSSKVANGSTDPQFIDLTLHQGVYLSTDNTLQKIAVIYLEPDFTIVGNTYDSLVAAQAVIAAGYKPGAGSFTGALRGSYGYTDAQAKVHANKINIALQFSPSGEWTEPVAYGLAHFDVSGNLIESASSLPSSQVTVSGTWTEAH